MVMESTLNVHEIRKVRQHCAHQSRVCHTKSQIDVRPAILSAFGGGTCNGGPAEAGVAACQLQQIRLKFKSLLNGEPAHNVIVAVARSVCAAWRQGGQT